MKLSDYNNFNDIYMNDDYNSLQELSEDIKSVLINRANKKGGHLGSGLGVVELTISLLKNFKLDDSIFLWDTGHQTHPYKLLTGRKDKFYTITEDGGISNFPEIGESEYDHLPGGHSSTSLNYAAGYSIVEDNKNIVVIIGDATFLTGLSFSGLLNISNINKKKITIILNDNLQGIGERNIFVKDWKMFFESLGFKYLFLEDGNNIKSIDSILKSEKEIKNNCVVHIMTEKSNGFKSDNNFVSHSIDKNNLKTISQEISSELNKQFNNEQYLICPSTISLTYIDDLLKKYPDNVFDVGINEESSLLVANAISLSNKKAIVPTQSSFFRRAYDQWLHDVVRTNSNILLLIDRAGLSYKNGVSHHGIHDVSMLNNLNTIICQPYTTGECKLLLEMGLQENDKPFVIRYENLPVETINENFKVGEWSFVKQSQTASSTIFSYGSRLKELFDYSNSNNIDVNIVNSRFIWPIDEKLLSTVIDTKWIVVEEVMSFNNLSSNIKNKFTDKEIFSFSINDENISHGNKEKIDKYLSLDPETIFKNI